MPESWDEEAQLRYRRAEERLREALTRFPESPALLASLGKCLLFQGRTDEALECILTSLELDPAQCDLLLRAADIFASKECFEEAMRFYELYQSLRPGSSKGYFRMGNCLFRQGYFWSAADAYCMALSRKPESRLLKVRLQDAMRLCATEAE